MPLQSRWEKFLLVALDTLLIQTRNSLLWVRQLSVEHSSHHIRQQARLLVQLLLLRAVCALFVPMKLERSSIEARTPLHNIINPLLIVLCLFLLTDVIKLIPNASLSAIVLVNLISLFKQFAELKPLWKTSWTDFGCFIVTTLFTVTMGTEAGLISGVVSSLVFLAIALLMVRKTPVSVEAIKTLTVPEGRKYNEN